MRSLLAAVLSGLIVLASVAPAPAGPVPGPVTADQVRRAIDDGKAFLRRQQKNNVWEVTQLGGRDYVGATVSLAELALITCGITDDDRPAFNAGLDYLRTIRPQLDADRHIAAGDHSLTYAVSLQTMVYSLVGREEDKERIQENVDWLMAARAPRSGGWSYGRATGSEYDGSNTQYALLALHEGIRSGARVEPKAMEEIRKFYLTVSRQNAEGGWAYRPEQFDASMTMTTAGLCGLIITGMDIEDGRHPLDKDGADALCGEYKENPQVAKALEWIADRFPAAPRNVEEAAAHFQTIEKGTMVFAAPYYGLYGVERAGRLTGRRFIGGHDWYRVGCQALVNSQNADGSWGYNHGIDDNPIVATCFALLFLGKGRTPVLMSKLAYGPPKREDWNRKHDDLRNVVEFASRELFKKQPMAWQVFDPRDQPAASDDDLRKLTGQLLESPLLFFSGHGESVPDGSEKDLLREYLNNGGFVFAEACCNSPEFDRKFRALIKELYPTAELRLLGPDHPLYTASGKFVSTPRDFPLWAVDQGCKTLVVYSPNAISGYWESNDQKSDKGRAAFALAMNVIAYATGLEAPRQKLDSVEVVDEPKTKKPRGYFQAAQLKHDGDWQPAPKAMHNLMLEARNLGVDVVLDPKEVHPSAEVVVDYRFLYMHGRNAFSFKRSELEHLRFDLAENGGLLFADACCGSRSFDESFRKFMGELWADQKDAPKLEPIPPDDELFGVELNGKKIDTVMCRRETPDGKGVDAEFKRVKPALEGIKLNGRWVVIYSRYDIGLRLERHATPGCLGHDYASAAALGKAAVLYALKR